MTATVQQAFLSRSFFDYPIANLLRSRKGGLSKFLDRFRNHVLAHHASQGVACGAVFFRGQFHETIS